MDTTTLGRAGIHPFKADEPLVTCPHCQHSQRIRSEYVGRRVTCRKCEQSFRVPADGTYRIVATSFEQKGSGPYTLRIRELKGGN